jgi:hypothetical protein
VPEPELSAVRQPLQRGTVPLGLVHPAVDDHRGRAGHPDGRAGLGREGDAEQHGSGRQEPGNLVLQKWNHEFPTEGITPMFCYFRGSSRPYEERRLR